jgi:uncharacterized protein YbjT (DUF2867 family)
MASVAPGNVFAAHHRASANMPAQKRVLCIGNIGALGEALIARLISTPGYSSVITATRFPMQSTTSRLTFCAFDDLETQSAWPAVDDVVMLVNGKASFYKRDDVFPVLDEARALSLAKIATSAGVKRLLVIAPMDAWLSSTFSGIAHFGELETQLRTLAIDDLIVLRPSEHRAAKAKNSLVDRIADGMLGALGHYMIPQRFQPLRAQIVADASVDWLTTLTGGQHFLNAEHLNEWRDAKYGEGKKQRGKL